MNTVQATAYGAKLILALLFGVPPKIDAKSTMNERLDIEPNARPTATEPVRLSILTAGIKGHIQTTGVEGIPLISPANHLATDASLFGPMPFCMRPTDDDLVKEERDRYCLRKEVKIGTANYYAYFGLRVNIDPDVIDPEMILVTTENGNTIEEPFVPDTENLYPTPITLPTAGAVTTTDQKIVIKQLLNVPLTKLDIAEYVNCAKIMYGGDERYAVWSEFALNTGANRVVQVQSSQGPVNFNESIGTQPYAFAADYKAVYFNDQDMDITFDVGNQVPLLGVQSIPTLQTIPTP